jgi:hypothetical protein
MAQFFGRFHRPSPIWGIVDFEKKLKMGDQKKVQEIEEKMKKKETVQKQEIPRADNAGKLVNSGRSKNQKDLEIKNKITGAEFDGPPY